MYFIRTSYNKLFRLVTLSNLQITALSSRNFAFDLNEQVIQVDNYNINYSVNGNGDHNVLLLPGLLGTMQSDFDPLIIKLDKTQYTLISWDPIGYGKSRPPQRQFTYDVYEIDAKIVGKLMEKLERRSYSVVGMGEGAITAITLATLRPENLRRAVLIAPMSFVTKDDVKRCEGLSRKPKLTHDLEMVYGANYAKAVWTNYCEYFEDVLAHKKGEICRSLLTKVKCPTLVLHGELDSVVPLNHGKYVAKHITGAEIQVIKKGEHRFLFQFSDLPILMIQDFLSRSEVPTTESEREVVRPGWVKWKPPKYCRGRFAWHNVQNTTDFIPPGAVHVGRDKDGARLYLGRGEFQGDLLPGKVRENSCKVLASHGNKEVEITDFQILESHDIAWQRSDGGPINEQAIVVGKTSNGEDLYMGRVYYKGTITPGKVLQSQKCLYIPFKGKEIKIEKDYEIMLLL